MRWLVGPMIVLLPHVGMAAQLSGFYKSFSVAFDSPQVNDSVTGMMSNRLRLNLADSFSEHMSFDLAYDFILRIQDPSLFENQAEVVTVDPLDYRVADLSSPIYPGDNDPIGSVGVFQNLDRANVTARLSFADVIVGRQAIAWGSARVINPTDVIAPFTYSELDTEDRTGVDAVRVRVPIGALGEFDAGYVFGRDFAADLSAFFVRSQFNAAETDLSPLLIRFREQLLVGIDVARGIGRIGAWIEGVRVFTMERAEISDYFRVSTGMDYSFGGETYGFIEYHFNGAGVRDPEDYVSNLDRPAYRDAAVYLMGTHYFALGTTHLLTPLVALSGQFLANVADPSFFFAPAIEYNIAQDIYLSSGAFIGIGDRPKSEHFQSEFGGYSNILFFSFRIYY
ncbi:MAG: hypothetical protein J4F29_05235 [Candidatus Latescibacteria bacterium]|nr:hypothetical protein [Candidatus Latescibacterota bacterium]